MNASNAASQVDVHVDEVPAAPATLAVAVTPLPPILPATVPPGIAEPVGLPAVGDPRGPAALLRGSARGLEIVVDARAALAEIVAVLTGRLGEAPGFFRGSDVRIRVEHGPLPAGALSRLDEIASVFDLHIVEVGALSPTPPAASTTKRADDAVPRANLAHGSAPSSADGAEFGGEEDTLTRAPLGLPALELLLDASRAATLDVGKAGHTTGARLDARSATDAELDPQRIHDADTVIPGMTDLLADPDPEPAISRAITQEMTPLVVARTATEYPKVAIERTDDPPLEPITTRIVVGPVRSGVILDHPGHLIVFGDVNPGAEVRAEGNIVVLGRLRGTAHAGIGNDSGFILALRLEPQQLRICRQVARAGDSDAPGTEAEIAYVTDASIVVERYAGRLPKNLAASI